MSQAALAAALEMPVFDIIELEKSRKPLGFDLARKLARVLKVHPGVLVSTS